MVEIEKPRIECNEKNGDSSYGMYVVEPLEHGYGTTLGNALRRISKWQWLPLERPVLPT